MNLQWFISADSELFEPRLFGPVFVNKSTTWISIWKVNIKPKWNPYNRNCWNMDDIVHC